MIAKLMKNIIIDKAPTEKVRKAVIDFRREFQKVHYAFDNKTEAYQYIRIR